MVPNILNNARPQDGPIYSLFPIYSPIYPPIYPPVYMHPGRLPRAQSGLTPSTAPSQFSQLPVEARFTPAHLSSYNKVRYMVHQATCRARVTDQVFKYI